MPEETTQELRQQIQTLQEALRRQVGKNTYWRNRYKRLQEEYRKLQKEAKK